MERTNKRRPKVASGLRNKLMAAIAMLMVSSIMVVSTTYAWFTLSTAPEVTGITTSVGANGNLEMALLNTNTYNNLGSIASAVGNSSAVQSVTDANITWGNLIDLAEEQYGLHSINLQPSRLNVAAGASTISNDGGLLRTPIYGKDGRVVSVDGKTYASGHYDAGKWIYDQSTPTWGVRAIGSNDNLSAQQVGLIAAKAEYNTNLNRAKSAIQGALASNGNELASAITTLAMNSAGVTLTENQQNAIKSMVAASGTSLNYIDAAYKQVLLAAASTLDATAYATAVSAINGAASYSAAVAALGSVVTVPSQLTDAAAALDAQKAVVTAAQGNVDSNDYKAALNKLVDTTKINVNGYKVGTPTGENPDYSDYLMGADGNINSTFMTTVINDGGAIVSMPNGSGVFSYVASVAGNYSASCIVSINYKQLTLNNMKATMKTTATVDQTIGNVLKGITANGDSGGTTVLSDTYGYALDFAFRTNAANSYLQLQTVGAQRVYGDSNSAATMGGGSTMTFQSATTDAGNAVLSEEQIRTLMGAIRVAFIDPANGTIYGIASLDNIVKDGDSYKGELTLKQYSVSVNGVMSLDVLSDDPATTDRDERIALKALNQNEITRMSAVVWMDGDQVDNGDVANAAQSLVGSMNLQFSSSAELIPMQNSGLNNMEIKYTADTGVVAEAGYYEFNNVMYKLNPGYKIYKGSDNYTYFSNDETNYTKLTSMNTAKAMLPVTASVSGPQMTVNGQNPALTATLTNATIKEVAWASSKTAVATVTGTDANATLNTVAVGETEITATITYTLTGANSVTTDKTIVVKYTVTVIPEILVNGTNTVAANGKVDITATINGVASANVAWRTSNPAVASVADKTAGTDYKAEVTGVAAGTAVITLEVTYTDANGQTQTLTATFTMTVTAG